MEFQMLDQEFWYGGAVYEGYRQPVGMKAVSYTHLTLPTILRV